MPSQRLKISRPREYYRWRRCRMY
uniref:Uncharacterized protein n=1 Tax=Anguilla anguilla TaxID=7936 RepID=A0A0E9VF29_ANGAN